MRETTLENITTEKILKAFEATAKVEEGKQNISLFFSKNYKEKDENIECKVSTSQESFSSAKHKLSEKLRSGYNLEQISISFMNFADASCHLNLLREDDEVTYKFEEDFELDPRECIVSCGYKKECKTFYKAIMTKFNKKA